MFIRCCENRSFVRSQSRFQCCGHFLIIHYSGSCQARRARYFGAIRLSIAALQPGEIIFVDTPIFSRRCAAHSLGHSGPQNPEIESRYTLRPGLEPRCNESMHRIKNLSCSAYPFSGIVHLFLLFILPPEQRLVLNGAFGNWTSLDHPAVQPDQPHADITPHCKCKGLIRSSTTGT